MVRIQQIGASAFRTKLTPMSEKEKIGFRHSYGTAGQNVGIGAEMNPLNLLQSEKKLVDVTRIEPVTLLAKNQSAQTWVLQI
jgi:hypothetical protein